MIKLTRIDNKQSIYLSAKQICLVEDNQDKSGTFVYLTCGTLRNVTESPQTVREKVEHPNCDEGCN